jgi:hypothetical protein
MPRAKGENRHDGNQEMDTAAAAAPVMEIPLGIMVYDADGKKWARCKKICEPPPLANR